MRLADRVRIRVDVYLAEQPFLVNFVVPFPTKRTITMSEHSQNSNALRWHQRLALELLWGICCLVGYMPQWVHYGVLQPFVYVLLRIVRYRHSVVFSNLTLSFPDMSNREIRRVANRAYWSLAEVIVGTITLAGASLERKRQHLTWINREEHLARTHGRDWIAMASHYGCWEYFPMWSLEDNDCHFIGVYHPLTSAVFEHLYRRLRRLSSNHYQVTMQDTVRHYIKNRSDKYGIVLGLISDQNPPLRADTEWFDFLNRKTAFIDGGERLAMRFNIPVYFLHIERVKAGHYALRLDEIYDGVEDVAPTEITQRYATRLESMIKARPELWVWSHRRWKHSPEKQERLFGAMTKSGMQS